MSAKLKAFLIVCAKIAVNAVLTSVAFTTIMSGTFSVTTANGWWNLGKAMLIIVGGRELVVWVPVWLNWSNTNASPSVLQGRLDQAAASTKQATSDIEQAKSVAPKPPAPRG